MRLRSQGAWLPWLSIALLGLLCGILAFLQYRWMGQIAIAERTRLREDLQSRLNASSHAFNEQISSALHDLVPAEREVAASGLEAAWSAQYLRWKAAHEHLLARAGIEVRGDSGIRFLSLSLQTGQLAPAERPDTRSPTAVELPLPGRGMLFAELDLNYLRTALLPAVLNTYLANSGTREYDIEVVSNGRLPTVIYASTSNDVSRNPVVVWNTADASAPLLDLRQSGPPGGRGRFDDSPFRKRPPGPPPGLQFGESEGRGPFDGRPSGGPPGGPPPGGPGRWRLLARHKSGSLEALVAETQHRNLAVSGAVLLLILGTVAVLIRYSRQAQRLAELQMNFVTGVSHELRTPLTVIRTAAYNLRKPDFRRSEDRVEQYGKMIETEAGKLEGLVDQVMRFSSANAGHAARNREPVAIAGLIEAEIAGVRGMIESRGVVLDERIESGLPIVIADSAALRQALRNLLDNALKYGVEDSRWIGVYARTIQTAEGRQVEICVADKGPGIPGDEQSRIFDAFFRGRRALHAQVHGTGLGLNLVKSIVEAHAGRIEVESDAAAGTRFTVRIPAAPPEFQTGAEA